MKWLLHTNNLNLTGTAVAVRDYSQGLLKMGHEVTVAYSSLSPENDPVVVSAISKSAELLPYENFLELEPLARTKQIERAYFIKSGERDDKIFSTIDSCIHAVFPTAISEIHGDKFAFVSEWLSLEYSNGKVPWVPHIVDLPAAAGCLRSELNIPRSSLVFGGMGGSESFDIGFVKRIVVECVSRRSDLYFIFLNISPFAQHDRIHFLRGNSSLEKKVRFIQTSDAMIHARGKGESFGLACAEFSSKNKPIITYAFSQFSAHLQMLGNSAVIYRGSNDLRSIILNSSVDDFRSGSWDQYSLKFSSREVMKIFSKVFIEPRKISSPSITSRDLVALKINEFKRRLKRHSRKFWSTS